jgi:hypothetical protein
LAARLSPEFSGGIGHSITLLVVGSAIILFGIVIPERLGMGLEFCVALMLILLGWLNLRAFKRSVADVASIDHLVHEHVHQHGDYIHRHAHAHDPGKHGHSETEVPTARLDRQFGRSQFYRMLRPVIVGVVHGLAGSAAVTLLVLPIIRDPLWATMYLLIFGCRHDRGNDAGYGRSADQLFGQSFPCFQSLPASGSRSAAIVSIKSGKSSTITKSDPYRSMMEL